MSEVKTLRYMFDWASAMCSDGPRGWSTLVEKDIPHPGFFEDGQAKNLVELIDRQAYDALAAQRDEGLAREAEFRKENESLQERLTEAETMPVYFKDCNFQGFNNDGSGPFVYEHLPNGIKKVVSVRMVGWICQGPVPYTGCADGEKP